MKETRINFRIKEEDKEKVLAYCKNKDIKITDLIKILLKKEIEEGVVFNGR